MGGRSFSHPAWLLLVTPIVWLALWRNLGEASLATSDEAAHTDVARNILERGRPTELWYFDEPYGGKPPLKIWLSTILMRWLGEDEVVVRLPDASFATLTTLLVWSMARSRLPGPAAVAAPIIFVTAPYPLLVHGWRQGVQDSALVFFMTLAAWCFLRYEDAEGRDRSRWLLAMALAVGAGSLVKTVVSFMVYLPFGLHLLAERRGRRIAELLAAAAGSALPWLLWYHSNIGAELRWNFYQRVTEWKETPHPPSVYWQWLKEGLHPWGWLLPVAGLLLLWGAVRGRKMDRFLLIWVIGLIAPWPFANLKHPWYVYPAYPALALALSRLVFPPEVFTEGARGRLRTTVMILGSLAFLAGARFAVLQAWWALSEAEVVPFHRVADWIEKLPEKERQIGVFLDPRAVCPDERYYLARGSVTYVSSVAELVSLAASRPTLVAVLPEGDLPALMEALAPMRELQTLRHLGSWPRCRHAPEVGRLPQRVILSFGAFSDPGPLHELPRVRPWDGFGQMEANSGGTFCWLSVGRGRLWFPFASEGTLHVRLNSFHVPRNVMVELPGCPPARIAVPASAIEVDLPVSVPLGGGFGVVESLDDCTAPAAVDPKSLDHRCLGVSVGALRFDAGRDTIARP